MIHRNLQVFLLPALLVSCADRPPTAIVAAIAADEATRAVVTHVRLQGIRYGEARHDAVYSIDTFKAPGTLTFSDKQRGESAEPLRVVVEGFDRQPSDPSAKRLISRSARLRFITEKSKLLRLGLAKDCLNVSCDPGDTCYRGECKPEQIDDPDSELPDASDEQVESPGRGIAFPEFGGAAGASGSAGAAGAGGAGAGGAGAGGAGASGASGAGAGGVGGAGAGGAGSGGGGAGGGGGSGAAGAAGTCGDGEINGDETCDGDKLGDTTCASATGKADAVGDVSCSDTCELVTAACAFCGDGALNNAEACDKDQFGSATCASLTGHADAAGALACKDTCEIDSSACTFCGDGARNGPEACEGADLNAATCATATGLDDATGTVSCTDACAFDTGACISCKDGKTNGAETDQDCGGGVCDKCALDKICKVDDDCESGRCRSGKCGPDITFAMTTTVASDASVLAVGDFDGDSKLDVAAVTGKGSVVTLFKGDGAGKLTMAASPPAPLAADAGAVAMYGADLNADSKVDLLVVQQNPSTIRPLRGNGDGTFTSVGDYGSVVPFPSGLALGDFNKDNKLDLAISANFADEIGRYKGNGDGSFTSQLAVKLPANADGRDILSGDVDGDGDTDLIVVLRGLGQTAALVNDGSGTFAVSTHNLPAGIDPQAAQLTRLTKGGPLNLVVGDASGNVLSLLEGDSKGAFTAAPTAAISVSGAKLTPIAADFDGDGLPDILVVADGQDLAVVQNNGSYSFQVRPTALPAIAAAVGDFNNDGKPDVACITASGLSIGLNTTPNP